MLWALAPWISFCGRLMNVGQSASLQNGRCRKDSWTSITISTVSDADIICLQKNRMHKRYPRLIASERRGKDKKRTKKAIDIPAWPDGRAMQVLTGTALLL